MKALETELESPTRPKITLQIQWNRQNLDPTSSTSNIDLSITFKVQTQEFFQNSSDHLKNGTIHPQVININPKLWQRSNREKTMKIIK